MRLHRPDAGSNTAKDCAGSEFEAVSDRFSLHREMGLGVGKSERVLRKVFEKEVWHRKP